MTPVSLEVVDFSITKFLVASEGLKFQRIEQGLHGARTWANKIGLSKQEAPVCGEKVFKEEMWKLWEPQKDGETGRFGRQFLLATVVGGTLINRDAAAEWGALQQKRWVASCFGETLIVCVISGMEHQKTLETFLLGPLRTRRGKVQICPGGEDTECGLEPGAHCPLTTWEKSLSSLGEDVAGTLPWHLSLSPSRGLWSVQP